MTQRRLIVPRVPQVHFISVVTAVVMGLTGCASPSGPRVPPPDLAPVRGIPPLLTWIGEVTRPSGTAYATLPDSTRYGGVSGLAYDAGSGEWLGVIDDRAGTRVAWHAMTFDGGQLQVTPTRLVALTAGPGVRVEVATAADLEAVVVLPDGTYLMAEEGHRAGNGVWQPSLLQVTREGVVTGVVPFPRGFELGGDPARGLRNNQGFESLTRLPNGRLVAGLEQPLLEDGAPPTFDQGAYGRLVEFEPRNRTWQAGREWRYPIAPTPRVEGYEEICDGGENGLVDLLALSNTLLLALERACLIDPAGRRTANAIQVFAVELAGAGVRKTRVLDLSHLTDRLSPALARLDNFEALAFGPSFPGSGPTLLVASDDNFNKAQKQSFLLFGMRMIQ